MPIRFPLPAHSFARDPYSQCTNISSLLRNSSNNSRFANHRDQIPSTVDFEIEWPIIEEAAYEELNSEEEDDDQEEEKENQEEVEEFDQGSSLQSEHDDFTPDSNHNNHNSNCNNDSRRPSTTSSQTQTCGASHTRTDSRSRYRYLPTDTHIPQESMRAPVTSSSPAPPPPLIIHMSAFKTKKECRYPPAPPPSPAWTPPPSPPWCPPYEEHQTLGRYNVPIITNARPPVPYSMRPTPPNSAGPSRVPSRSNLASPSSSEGPPAKFEEYRAFDFGVSSYGAGYDSAIAPAPSVPLYRTTSQPSSSDKVLRKSKSRATISPSKSSPSSPTADRGSEKVEQSVSFFEWDLDPEPFQWGMWKSSKNRNKRRGSDSDESQTGKKSVREKAGRLCKRLESAFSKSK
ncbi:hypothetical protein TWF696_005262 [Orbilia brochopaga]|uniref:Uncharacterized protein n=1 Tax=Orbilia brochopaga TaxID=3140254 RepID=A0AAV9V1V8_9PEZI